MRWNESVSMRATVAGITMLAATRVAPRTCIVARIVDGEDEHQHRVDAGGVQAGGLGDLGVERREQQRPVGEEHDAGDEHGDDDDRHDVVVVDAEDAAEQGGVEAVAAPAEDGEQGQAEGERARS